MKSRNKEGIQIALLDDSLRYAQSAQTGLELELSGVNVDIFTTKEEIRGFSADGYDIILVDYHMFGFSKGGFGARNEEGSINGYDLAKEYASAYPETIVVLNTGDSEAVLLKTTGFGGLFAKKTGVEFLDKTRQDYISALMRIVAKRVEDESNGDGYWN